MTAASGAAHGLLLRHAATSDGQLALPVDPAAIARAEGVDMPPVQNAYGRWTWAPSAGTVSSTRHPIRIGQPDASVRGDAWLSAKETEDES